jgi:hypothetical protein
MAKFRNWLEEAKKKGTKESLPPTATSSPTRGANQDQSGFNGKNDVADYTISDETKPKKKKELDEYEGLDNWEENPVAKRIATSKELANMAGAMHMPHQKIKEASMVAAVGANRIQPVNQADNTPRKGEAGVSKRIISGLQSSANRRVSALDKAAQDEKNQSEKNKEDQQKKMEDNAKKREAEAAKQRQKSQTLGQPK